MAMRKKKTATSTVIEKHDHDFDYAVLLESVSARIAAASSFGPLFCTDAEEHIDMNAAYLTHITPLERGVHNCSACRHFIRNFGSLAFISEAGEVQSAVWNAENVPLFYKLAINTLQKRVEAARITGPFLSSAPVIGTPKTGDWTHFSGVLHSVYKGGVLTDRQKMAAKREDFKTVRTALVEFAPAVLKTALQVFEGGHLNRSEKFVAPLHWLYNLQTRYLSTKDRKRQENILWAAVASAPDGYCHPRSAVTGTLIEDLAAGLSFDDARRKFNAKTGALTYQRPTAAPTVGNIKAGEKIIEKLGLQRSLERRFATWEDVSKIWVPSEKIENVGSRPEGVFTHLLPKTRESPAMDISGLVSISWEKFARTVLPEAEEIEANIKPGFEHFIALTTAFYPDAPPLIRWDREDSRNPVSWYVYSGGSTASTWGLMIGWNRVTGITPLPNTWGDRPQGQHGEGAILMLAGAKDLRRRAGNGNALFPEHMRTELHEVRSTIEAFARTATLHDVKEERAIGLDIRKGSKSMSFHLRVKAGSLRTVYHVDRWD